MHTPLFIYDIDDAHEFMASFNNAAKRQGRLLYSRRAVQRLRCVEEGRKFQADVLDGRKYQVNLFYDEGAFGWDAQCTCEVEWECAHAFAALSALLEGQESVVLPKDAGRVDPLEKRLREVLQRNLKGEELRYVRQIQGVYQRCSYQQGITGWDLQTLGCHAFAYSWEQLKLWPSFPKDTLEFWQYLAYAFEQKKVPYPEFMRGLTDLQEMAARMARFEREQAVQHWQKQFETHAIAPAVIPSRRIDLRLVLGPEEAYLEWKNEGDQAFQIFKQTQVNRFRSNLANHVTDMPAEALLLWEALLPREWDYARRLPFRYTDPWVPQVLNRLLRLSFLQERIVTPAGAPLARPTEPLRWSLTPAQSEEENYQLRLVLPDGSPAPAVHAMLPGNPPLYLVEGAVYAGPAPCEGLNAAGPTAIPAPALETAGGLQFLTQLGLELPPRLAARVQHVKLTPKIVAQLQPTYPGSPTEVVSLSVSAECPEPKMKEVFRGESWQKSHAGKAEKNGKLILTDRSSLQHFPAVLTDLGAKWDYPLQCWTCRAGKNLPEKFIPWLQSLPKDIEVVMEGELASLSKDPLLASVQLECEEVGVDWFDLKVNISVGETDFTPDELKALLDAHGRYVRLGKKGWHRISLNVTQEQDEQLARLGLSTSDFSAAPQRLHALQLADEAAAQFLPEQQFQSIRKRVGELKTRVNPPLPEGVKAELRPYQVEGFHFLAYLSTNSFGGILADDMGLGKTIQTLTWLSWLRSQPEAANKPALVVCPKSVMDNWRAEAARFVPELRVKLWQGTDGSALKKALGETDLLVMNYAQLRALGDEVVKPNWLAAILDEGQYIKNPESQTAQVARLLKADYRLALSGTPIENRLLDLWSLMAFAMPGVLGNRLQFAKKFDAKEDPLARRRLVARVRPFLLRRTKGQVATDLPERMEEDLYCDMEGKQRTLYRAEFKRAQQMLLNIKTRTELNQFRFHFLTSLLRLRQICCHPALFDPGSRQEESAKVNALLDVLEPLVQEGHKVLVFSQFVSMLDILRETMKKREWPHFYLAGSTENRAELIQKFQETEGAAVFLLSLKAGGFGLNLTAASYVVLFDPWWNPAVENQAIDRTHRIGQTSNVIAYRLLAKDTIEEKIRALQRQKSALAKGVLDEETFSQSLTLEDLQFLFSEDKEPAEK